MWLKIKNIILAHLVQTVVVAAVIIIGVTGTSYVLINKGNSSDNAKESTAESSSVLCRELIEIGAISVEKDPAGDPEAWIRFDYISAASQAINCKYTISFYDSQEEIIRTIPDVENTFQAPSGQIHNGYSGTPYQAGMTAQVVVQ